MKFISAILFNFLVVHALSAQSNANEWPLFRGKSDLAGKIEFELTAAPSLLWSIKTGSATKSSPVISEGTVYFGNDKGALIAVGTDSRIKWKYEARESIDAAPMVIGNKVIFGASDGILRAVDKISGKLIWSYTTDTRLQVQQMCGLRVINRE